MEELMKIDIFNHVLPERYKKALYKYADRFATEKAVQDKRPVLTDIQARLRIMEEYEGLVQVLSAAMPPVEEILSPGEAVELAKIANDEMANLVDRYPGKFVGAIANLPYNDMDAALKEAERAVKKLGFKGIQLYTRVNGKPLSSEELYPLYELMASFDLPIWLHPMRGSAQPDYAAETVSYNQIFSIFGWPYDTTAAMTRLVFSGIFEKLPAIKFITHHAGAMVPYFADRIVVHYDNGLERLGASHFPGLTKHPIEYFRMFYNDTALNGAPSSLRCALDFFGEDRLLFGTDLPFDIENGVLSIRKTIEAIETMGADEQTRNKIYEGNARKILHL
jgi:aminocarboxymuconate-semialdehyde decarboxylase